MKLWVVVGVAVTVMSVTVTVVGVAVTVVGGDGPQSLAKTTGSPRKPGFSSPSYSLPLISKSHHTYNHEKDFPNHNTSLHNHNTNLQPPNHNTSLHSHNTSSRNHESSHYNHNPSCLEHNISLHNQSSLFETVNKKGNIYKMMKEHVGTGVLNMVVQYFFDKLGTLESRSFGTTYIGDVAFYQSQAAEDATYHQSHTAEGATYYLPKKSTYPEPPYSWYHGGGDERKEMVKTPVRKQKHGGACIDAYTNFHSSSLCLDVSTALAILGLAILLQLFFAFSVELVCPNSNFGSFDDVVFSVRNENNVTVDSQGGNQTQDQTQTQDQMQDEYQYQDQVQDEYQSQDQSEYQYEYQEQYQGQDQNQDVTVTSGRNSRYDFPNLNDTRVMREALRSRMFPSLQEWSWWTTLQDMGKSFANSRFFPKAAFFCSTLRGFVDG